MRDAAMQVLATKTPCASRTPASSKQPRLKQYATTPVYAIYGYEQGGFAVVSADDALPVVLGYSTTCYGSELPEGLQWWLNALEGIFAHGKVPSHALQAITPDTVKYKPEVKPLTTAMWGQSDPFWKYCPRSPKGTHTLTGCVATAMAEIMYYWKYPARGRGEGYVMFPYNDPSGERLVANFAKTNYDWAQMLPHYSDSTATVSQEDAVATLMYHCGIAAKMQYGTLASGAYCENAAKGLKEHFRYASSTRYLLRENFNDSTWMDLIFNELNNNQPILYSGVDNNYGGHAFVLDGYDADGLVYINWGWNGKYNGYYDIKILNGGNYQFEWQQGMVAGIRPSTADTALYSDTISVDVPGSLSRLVGKRKNNISTLKVKGNLNSSDLKCLREMAGCDSSCNGTLGMLCNLDLSQASIVAGGSAYLVDKGKQYTTQDSVIPERAFYGCEGLSRLILPESIKSLSPGFISRCSNLDTCGIALGSDKNYVVRNGIVYNKDKTIVLQGLGFASGDTTVVDDGAVEIAPYAFSGVYRSTHFTLPSSLRLINTHGLNNYMIRGLRCAAETPPALGDSAIAEIQKDYSTLYVPVGSKKLYSQASGWNEWLSQYNPYYRDNSFDNIKEYGSLIRAKNATRLYGEANPQQFSWTVEGEPLTGTPAVYCLASEKSPVGKYAIVVERGTVTGDNIELVPGVLKVMPAPLAVIADTVEREYGAPNPPLTFHCQGFVNGETDTVFTVRPVASTTATATSPVGLYPIVVEGGEAMNYELSYVDGVLKVLASSGVRRLDVDAGAPPRHVYNLNGTRLPLPSGGIHDLPAGIYVVGGKLILIK